RDGVADYDEIWRGFEVLGAIAVSEIDAEPLEQRARRRIDVLVGAADLEPSALQHAGERGHRDTGDRDQVHSADGTQVADDPRLAHQRGRSVTEHREQPA